MRARTSCTGRSPAATDSRQPATDKPAKFRTGALQTCTGRFARDHAGRPSTYGRGMTRIRDRVRTVWLAPIVSAAAAALVLPPGAAAAGDWAWPVRGQVITPYRNGANPYAGGQH